MPGPLQGPPAQEPQALGMTNNILKNINTEQVQDMVRMLKLIQEERLQRPLQLTFPNPQQQTKPNAAKTPEVQPDPAEHTPTSTSQGAQVQDKAGGASSGTSAYNQPTAWK